MEQSAVLLRTWWPPLLRLGLSVGAASSWPPPPLPSDTHPVSTFLCSCVCLGNGPSPSLAGSFCLEVWCLHCRARTGQQRWFAGQLRVPSFQVMSSERTLGGALARGGVQIWGLLDVSGKVSTLKV